MKRWPIVGVMGSGDHSWVEWAEPLGIALASRPVHLLTGGGRGVMESVSRAFCSVKDRKGQCLAIIPRLDAETIGFYPHAFADIVIHTGLVRFDREHPDRHSRNHVNIATSDIVVALPGGRGTRHEVSLALAWDKPLIGVGWGDDGPQGCPMAQSVDDVLCFIDAQLPVVQAHTKIAASDIEDL